MDKKTILCAGFSLGLAVFAAKVEERGLMAHDDALLCIGESILTVFGEDQINKVLDLNIDDDWEQTVRNAIKRAKEV